MLRAVAAGFLGCVCIVMGCASSGPYVWADQIKTAPSPPRDNDYEIKLGDMVVIRVFNQEQLSSRARVRPDGRLAVPLLGEVTLAGRRPKDVSSELEERLKPFVVSPNVSIFVEDGQPVAISVLGEVTHPGAFSLDASTGCGVLQALAAAGGPTEYADKDRIFVLRQSLSYRVRFTYEGLMKGEGTRFALHSGDVLVVE